MRQHPDFGAARAAALALVLLCCGRCPSAQEAGGGPYAPTWESLRRHTAPDWYQDAKFGIFIHWGVYSVPAFSSEWYPRNMYRQDSPEYKHHLKTHGAQRDFGYKDFIPMFRAEKFDPADWAALFKKAGAKYVVPVAEHHDGFQMYDSEIGEYNAAKMGPKRDIVGELAGALLAEGLVLGVSSHRAEHWWFFDGGMAFDSDVRDGRWDALYGPARPEKGAPPDKAFLDDWLARCKELVDKYQPQVFWFDWWIEQPVFEPYLREFAAYYYNRGLEWNRGVAINYKNKAFPDEAAVLDIERGKLEDIRTPFWQTDTSVSVRSWGYIEKDHFRTTTSLLHELADIVSKNGCLLLNVGPRADGTIPDEARAILLEMGAWLEVNGEAIYGTRPWVKYGEGPTKAKSGSFSDHSEAPMTSEDIRFTARDGVLYAIVMAWPEKKFKITSLGTGNREVKIASVSLLGCDEALKWKVKKQGLEVSLPKNKPCGHAYALKILLEQ